MKLPSQIGSGVTLEDILRKKYPDINFDITTDNSLNVTEIDLTKRQKDGSKAMVRIRFTRMAVDSNPTMVNDMIERAVWKLREYSESKTKEIVKSNNPSSRSFG